NLYYMLLCFFFSSRRRHTRFSRDWSSDVCSSDLLLSIYHKENPAWFDRSMESIWDDQGVKPSEIVLVNDGPLNTGLDSVLEKWKIGRASCRERVWKKVVEDEVDE